MTAGLIFFRHPRDLLSGISILDILYEYSIPAQKHYRDDGGCVHYRDDGGWTHYQYDCRFDFFRHPRDLLSGISILAVGKYCT
jgi:hypothetical protein